MGRWRSQAFHSQPPLVMGCISSSAAIGGSEGSAIRHTAGADAASGQSTTQEVLITRTASQPLGMHLLRSDEGILLTGIHEHGVVWAWNATHPERKLAAGDRLIMVNSLRVESTWQSWCAVLAEMRKTTVTLVVVEGDEGSSLQATQSCKSLDHILPGSFMDRLPRVSAAERGVTECCVCLEDLEPTAEVVLLPCKHVFHPGCAETWLTRVPTLKRAQCPLCRQHLPLQLKQEQDRPPTMAMAPVVGAAATVDTPPAAVQP